MPATCSRHGVTDCPVLDCRIEANDRRAGRSDEGKEAISPSPLSDSAPARGGPYYPIPAGAHFPAGVAMSLTNGNHRVCSVEGGLHTPQEIADALNMLHHVRAGAAGDGAAAPLDWNNLYFKNGVLHVGNGVTIDLAPMLAAAGWHRMFDLQEVEPGRRFRITQGGSTLDLVAVDHANLLDAQLDRLAHFLRFDSGVWYGDTTEMEPATIVDKMILHANEMHRRNENQKQTIRLYQDEVRPAPGRDPDTALEIAEIVRQVANETPSPVEAGTLGSVIINRIRAHIGQPEAPEADEDRPGIEVGNAGRPGAGPCSDTGAGPVIVPLHSGGDGAAATSARFAAAATVDLLGGAYIEAANRLEAQAKAEAGGPE